MLGDVFSEDKRALAMGIFNSGIFIGFGGSFAIGNYVKDTTIFEEVSIVIFNHAIFLIGEKRKIIMITFFQSWRTSFLVYNHNYIHVSYKRASR